MDSLQGIAIFGIVSSSVPLGVKAHQPRQAWQRADAGFLHGHFLPRYTNANL